MGKRIIVLDAETTGLDAETDEILQLTILSDDGEVLFNNYFRPTKHTSWPDAERIHHISFDMVKDCAPIAYQKSAIQKILDSADIIVGYNHSFDMSFLEAAGIYYDPKKNYDLMLEFSQLKGDWDKTNNSYKWYKLKECADYFGYNWGNDETHNSLADAKATLYCYKKIIAGQTGKGGNKNSTQHPSGFQLASKKRRKKNPLYISILLIVIGVAVVVGAIAINNMLIPNRGKVTTFTTSSLAKIIDKADLSTMKYTYNSLTKAVDDKGKDKYYVSYKGTIKAGIDLSEIADGISIDKQTKVITIKLPTVKVQEISVDDGSLDFLFIKNKYNTDEAYLEGLKLCEKDLGEAAENESLISTAKENAKATIQAMLLPWIGQEYTVSFE